MDTQAADFRLSGAAHASRHLRLPAPAPIATVVLAAVIIIMIFLGGLRRGMDHMVEEIGIENDPTLISIALSDQVYHLNAGYLAYATVLNKLEEVWNRNVAQPRNATQYENDANRALLNEGIAAAASLGPQKPAFISDRTLVTAVYTDLGYADFIKLGFRLFGMKIESLYYTFFLLLSLSAAAYLAAFWRDPGAKIVLLCGLFAFFIEMHTAIFHPDMPTFPGVRHGSTLAIIPGLHFAFMVLYRRRFSVVPVVTSLVQLAILMLAIHIRGSAVWTLMLVVLASVAVALYQSRLRPADERTWRRLLADAAHWPVLLVVGGYVGYFGYVNTRLHPVYFTDDVMPYHGLWHSAYLGFAFEPDIVSAKNQEYIKKYGTGDAVGYFALVDYLDEIHFLRAPEHPETTAPAGYISPWTGTNKFKFHDDIMRRIFMRTILQHPLKALHLYLIAKPRQIYQVIGDILARSGRAWLWLVIAAGLVGGVLWAWSGSGAAKGAGGATALVVAAVLFAALPNLWAYAAVHTVADLFLALLILGQVGIAAVTALAIQLVASRWPLAQPLPNSALRVP